MDLPVWTSARILQNQPSTEHLTHMIDLHTHTYYSDGIYSPAELIQGAAERGLHILAITDHDNTRGSREAVPLASAAGIDLIPAMEITTSWPEACLPPGDQDVDLLGYFINLNDPAFQMFEEERLNDLHERIACTCQRLSEAGISLRMEEVFHENPRYAGAIQGIHAMIHKGIAPNWEEGLRLFGQFWSTSRPSRCHIQDAIQAIHHAGGVAVLAHPSIVRPKRQQLDEKMLRKLVDAGLDGIEVFHHRLDSAAREHFLKLAKRFGLLLTGGSDLHGWGTTFDQLGREPVSDEMIEMLRDRAAR